MSRNLPAVGACLAAILTATPCAAYMVIPLTLKLTPAGRDATARLSLSNSDPQPVDIEVVSEHVAVDESGVRRFEPAPEAFMTFPPQATIAPGATQTIAVRYVGDPALKAGQIYAIRVKQTNVTETPVAGGGAVNLSQNFIVMVSVNPDGAPAVVRLTAGPRASDGAAVVTLVNDGPAVADISTLSWAIVANGARQAIPVDAIQWGQTKFVAPGAARTLRIRDVDPGGEIVLAPPR